ncbi:MAG: hypothetical protein K8R41_03640 [Bacteroidales bacterium]|nr:hypothetical protein [Bacteroidales bacterium]
MECPVCHYNEIQKGTKICPECGANLEAFQTIEKIKKCKKTGNIFLIILSILSAIFLVACILIYVSFSNKVKTVENESVLAKTEINKLTTQIDQKNTEISALNIKVSKQEIKIVQETQKLKNKVHVVINNETLSKIAELYFGSGDMYPKLACDNDIIDPDFILTGQKIYIYY